ncbi:MAG: hypothetical protein WCP33_01645, partial [Deltaproteobacteria bacterium]
MKKLFVLPLMLLILGCAQNHFNVPADNFKDKVRVLGVAPFMIDSESEIKHPQKEELVPLVAEMNRTFESQFVRKLKATGSFYTVALLDGDPRQVFAEMFFRREKRDDATIRYNKYFWNAGGLKEYIRKNNLDAVMLIMVSGLSKTDKIFSGSLLKSKTSDYNYLIMTAQILDADGTILWEYPNFRNRILRFDPMINLQYPDFSESDANLSNDTNVKFKTIEGIRRAFNQKTKDLLLRETTESEIYGKQFDEMLWFLQVKQDKEKKDPPAMKEKPAAPAIAPAPTAAAPPAPVIEPP